VRVSVVDQGCGIPPEKIERILDALFHDEEAWNGAWPWCLPLDRLRPRSQAVGHQQRRARCDLSVHATHKLGRRLIGERTREDVNAARVKGEPTWTAAAAASLLIEDGMTPTKAAVKPGSDAQRSTRNPGPGLCPSS
jgi:hypothetical protein